MKKRFISGLLASIMTLQLVLVGALAADPEGYKDIPDNWAKQAVEYVIAQDYMVGSENCFRPGDVMTRVEFAVTLVRVLGLSEKGSLEAFSDADEDAWYYDELSIAAGAGIVEGDGSKIHPLRPITREEGFTMFARAFELDTSNQNGLDAFIDADQVSEWARNALAAMVDGAYVKGSNGSLNPQATMTRAEMAQLLYNSQELFGRSDVEETDPPLISQPETNENNSTGGGGGTGGTGGSGDAGNTDGNSSASVYKGDIIAYADLYNVEQVYYAVIKIKKDAGTLDDYTFALSGQAVRITPVNDQKTIGKIQVNPDEEIEISAASHDGGVTDSTSLSVDGAAAFTSPIDNHAPAYVLTNGAISVFDYYLPNYNKHGVLRVMPTKSTYDTVSEGEEVIDDTVPALFVAETLLGQDVTIEIDMTHGDAAQWISGIYAVRKDYGTGAGSRQDLIFSVTSDSIIVDASSPSINGYNGYHTMVVSSKGFPDAYVISHLVKEAGSITLSTNFTYWAHQDLLFELNDFNYGITNPIYAVYLDDVLLQGDCTEYHIVSNLIRLENGCLSRLTPGSHTLTVKAEGYQDFTLTFYLETANSGQENPTYGTSGDTGSDHAVSGIMALDGISAASGSGGSSSSGGGSAVLNGYIVFEFDLIANAFILRGLNHSTNYSEEVISWWYSMNKVGILAEDGYVEGGFLDISYSYYKNNVGRQAFGYTYSNFADLYRAAKGDLSWTDPQYEGRLSARPANVKMMLEDGLLGDIISGKEIGAAPAPELTILSASIGEGIVLEYEDMADTDAWLDAVVAYGGYGICLTGSNRQLNYTIDRDARTIAIEDDGYSYSVGNNDLTISANGFCTVYLTVPMVKVNPSQFEIFATSDGDIIISGFDVDYAAAVSGVQLGGRALLNDSQVGGTNGGYELRGTVMVLRAKLFDEDSWNQQQTLVLIGTGYDNEILQFTPRSLEINDESAKAEVPSIVALDESNTYYVNAGVKIITGQILNDDYGAAITNVTVNGNDVSHEFSGTWYYTDFTIDGAAFPTPGEYEIAIEADGYKDKTFSVTIEALPVQGLDVPSYVGVSKSTSSSSIGNTATISLGSTLYVFVKESWMGSTDAYMDAITDVKVDGISLPEAQRTPESYSQYFTVTFDSMGSKTIEIIADGYQTATFTIEVTGKAVSYGTIAVVNGSSTSSIYATTHKMTLAANTALQLAFGEVNASESNSARMYREAITDVQINGQSLGSIAFETMTLGSFLTYDYAVLTIPAGQFQSGENIVTIIASNYEDAKITVTVS